MKRHGQAAIVPLDQKPPRDIQAERMESLINIVFIADLNIH